MRSSTPVQNQQTSELIRAQKTSHKQQLRAKLPTATRTWHVSKYMVKKTPPDVHPQN